MAFRPNSPLRKRGNRRGERPRADSSLELSSSDSDRGGHYKSRGRKGRRGGAAPRDIIREEARKQERLARVRLLRFDEEYAPLFAANAETTAPTANAQDELGKRLGLDSTLLAQSIADIDRAHTANAEAEVRAINAQPLETVAADVVREEASVCAREERRADTGEEPDALDLFLAAIDAEKSSVYTTSVDKKAEILEGIEIGGQVLMRAEEDEPSEEAFKKREEKLRARKEIRPTPTAVESNWRKNIYRECPEIAELSSEEVEALRHRLGQIKVRGNNPVRPVFSWYHCNLPPVLLELLCDRLRFGTPFPIQCQAIPAILAGRDVIGIAETGSGKTLAYALPMLCHVLAQRPLAPGEGPIGIVLVPTRELALQIFSTVKLLSLAIGLRCVTIYGGHGLTGQLAELKAGAEVVIATPGRFIDVLTAANGRVTNLARATFLVIDEADRMFDFGFEPQLAKVLRAVPVPTRQVVMFSATFPKNVEALAKNALVAPLEIVVGQRGQVARNIEHSVELVEESRKILRLLELLGEWLDRGSVIVFVESQAQADALYTQLLSFRHSPLLLHGGQDQADREETLREFRAAAGQLLVATSLAARGLDCTHTALVVNYHCPTYKEEYIHRIGRTGRAGRRGRAVTFLTTDDDRYAGDIIQALQISNAAVDPRLLEMYQTFKQRVHRGEAREFKNQNLGGRGFSFAPEECAQLQAVQRLLGRGEGDSGDEAEETLRRLGQERQLVRDQQMLVRDPKLLEEIKRTAIKAAGDAIRVGLSNEEVRAAAQNAIRDFIAQHNPELGRGAESSASAVAAQDAITGRFSAELEINAYPEATRRRVSAVDFLAQMGELTATSISVRGLLVKRGAKALFGQKRLHLFVEGESAGAVAAALAELRRICEESALGAI